MLRLLPRRLAAAVLLLPIGATACNLLDLARPRDPWTVVLCCWDGDLAIGDTARFQAIAREYFIGNGPEINSATSPDSYTWTSSNPAAATVDGHGLVRAVGLGFTSITATLHGPHAGRPGGGAVMVVPWITELVLELSADTILAGDTVQVQMAALDSVGQPVPDAIIRPFASQGLTLVRAEASVLENPGGRFWLAPARFTYRASSPGRYVVGVARPYMYPGYSYYGVEQPVVVR